VIDFTTACFYIFNNRRDAYKDEMNKNNSAKERPERKSIPFRDVIDCYFGHETMNFKSLPKNWQFPFML